MRIVQLQQLATDLQPPPCSCQTRCVTLTPSWSAIPSVHALSFSPHAFVLRQRAAGLVRTNLTPGRVSALTGRCSINGGGLIANGCGARCSDAWGVQGWKMEIRTWLRRSCTRCSEAFTQRFTGFEMMSISLFWKQTHRLLFFCGKQRVRVKKMISLFSPPLTSPSPVLFFTHTPTFYHLQLSVFISSRFVLHAAIILFSSHSNLLRSCVRVCS